MQTNTMRGLCEGAVARVWEVKERKVSENYRPKQLRISISESKKNSDGKYESVNTFSGYVEYNGPVKAETLTNATVVLLGVGTETHYDKAKKTNYVNHYVSNFRVISKAESDNESNNDMKVDENDDLSEGFPFE